MILPYYHTAQHAVHVFWRIVILQTKNVHHVSTHFSQDSLTFVATVVKEFATFWVNVS